jgi:hypothetical protein
MNLEIWKQKLVDFKFKKCLSQANIEWTSWIKLIALKLIKDQQRKNLVA